ncbi:MAG: DUF192 domain-containing protein [bacterium]|nr:DUF192 domain-containing protein [bacterium]
MTGPITNRTCWTAAAALAAFAGCSPSEPNNLPSMPQTDVKIKDHTFRAWIADDDEERERGLMHVPAEQMAPLEDGTERGMIFVFTREQSGGFWMKNTIIPLDIAFIRTDGKIVTIRTMAPLDTRGYFPTASYRYTLEVRGNVFSKLKIKTGDRVQIPESLLKNAK